MVYKGEALDSAFATSEVAWQLDSRNVSYMGFWALSQACRAAGDGERARHLQAIMQEAGVSAWTIREQLSCPKTRAEAVLTISMTNEHGQYFEDTIAVTFNARFELVSSRQQVRQDSLLNHFLRDEIAPTFIAALDGCELPHDWLKCWHGLKLGSHLPKRKTNVSISGPMAFPLSHFLSCLYA